MHTNIGVALKPNLKILHLHNKSPKIFALDIFGPEYICFRYIWSRMLSSSMLKLSKMSSPQKTVDYDCVREAAKKSSFFSGHVH